MQLKQVLIYSAIALLVLLLLFCVYRWFTADKKEGFEETPSVFRMFYVDWCGHCRNAKPEFAKILSVDKVNGKPLQVLMINAEANQALASEFNVSSYPTFVLSKSTGENIPYMGHRNENAFMSFLESNM